MLLKRIVESYKPDDLDFVLLSQLDDIAFSDFISLGVDLSIVKNVAIRVVDYIMLKDKISAMFKDKTITIPKPSRALKIISLETVTWMLDEEEPIPKAVIGISTFDGEEIKNCVELYIKYPFTPPPKSLREIENSIEDAIYYNDFQLVVYDSNSLIKELQKANLKKLANIVKEKAINIRDELVKIGIDTPSLASIVEEIKIKDLDVKPIDIVSLHSKLIEAINTKNVEEIFKSIAKPIQSFVDSRAKTIYILHLVANAIKNSST